VIWHICQPYNFWLFTKISDGPEPELICLFQEMIKLANLALDYIAHSNASGVVLRVITQLVSRKPELGFESKYWRSSRFIVVIAIRLSPKLFLEVGHIEAKNMVARRECYQI